MSIKSEIEKWKKVNDDDHLYNASMVDINAVPDKKYPWLKIYYELSTFNRHRVDGPAWVGDLGLSWWINGKRHRLYAPAFMILNKKNKWFINNIDITNEVSEWIKQNNYPRYTKWDNDIKLHFKLRFT